MVGRRRHLGHRSGSNSEVSRTDLQVCIVEEVDSRRGGLRAPSLFGQILGYPFTVEGKDWGRHGFAIALLLIIITTLLIYSNTLSVPFHFDDASNIVGNYQLRDLSNFWPPSGMRYIGYLSFAINYHFGGLDVFGYHLVNIIIHIINGLLIWRLIILTFGTPMMEGAGISRLKGFIALTSALIFISHPVQTQAVTYIVQRFASLATLFYLLSLILFIKGRLSLITQNSKLKTILYISLSILSAILAMKTKEISFTLPIIIVLYEFIFFGSNPPSTPVSKGGELKSHRRLLYLIPLLITLLIIPLSMVGVNKPIGDIIGEIREASQETGEIPRGVYLLTQFRVIVTYIRLLFLPVNQNLDYDYPLYSSISKPEVFLSFIFLLSIFCLAIYLLIQSRRRDNAHGILASFGILWFFITLSVESSIIPIRDVIFEHRLYLPGVGAVIAFSATIFYVLDYARLKISPLTVTCVLLLVTSVPLGIATYNRNMVWKDEITLWKDVVKKSPKNGRGYNNLGLFYRRKGQIDAAMSEYSGAIRLKPDYPYAHYNLGVIYEERGLFDMAIQEFVTTIRLKPDFAEVHYALGGTYLAKGQMDEAVSKYRETLGLEPNHLKAHYNLGVAYFKQGKMDEAITEYKKALELKPTFPEAHYSLGIAYFKQGKMDEAITEYKKALELKPTFPEAHYNLGVAYFKQGKTNEAMAEYREALRLKPDLPTIRQLEGRGYSNNRAGLLRSSVMPRRRVTPIGGRTLVSSVVSSEVTLTVADPAVKIPLQI